MPVSHCRHGQDQNSFGLSVSAVSNRHNNTACGYYTSDIFTVTNVIIQLWAVCYCQSTHYTLEKFHLLKRPSYLTNDDTMKGTKWWNEISDKSIQQWTESTSDQSRQVTTYNSHEWKTYTQAPISQSLMTGSMLN